MTVRPQHQSAIRTCRLIGAFSAGLMAIVPLSATLAVPGHAGDGQSIDLRVGGAVAVKPKYEGSKDYEIVGFPIVAPAGGNGDGVVQFRGLDDVRFRLFQHGGFEVGPLAGYRFGRDEDDSDRLAGLGDVDGGLVVGAYAAYDFGGLKPFISYHHQVTGDDSGLLRFGAETRLPVTTDVSLRVIVGATYANNDHMTSYFSVPNVVLPSGLAPFDASSGIKDVYVDLGTSIPLTDTWMLNVNGRYAQLLGDAADSTLTETEHQFFGGLGLTYKFSIDR